MFGLSELKAVVLLLNYMQANDSI